MGLHDIWRGDVMPLSGVAVAIGRNAFDPPAPVVPVYDIHCRSIVAHDSGAPAQSGIISFNSKENRVELIPSQSGAQPFITHVAIEVLDSAGGNTIAETATTITFDTTRVNTHPDVFAFDNVNDAIQINMSGVYEFEYRTSLANGTATIQTYLSFAERQAPGGAFAEIPGTRAWDLLRNSTTVSHEATTNCRFMMDAIGVGDKFRIRALTSVAVAGDPIQLANGSNLIIRTLA